MREIRISENEANQRLDKFLRKYMDQAPMSFFYKMLRKKNILLNGGKASGKEKLSPGDVVKLFLSDETIAGFTGSAGKIPDTGRIYDLDIIYEDPHILVINKPAGMLSQKAKASDVSMAEAVTGYLVRSGQLSPEELRAFHPGICNRLDRNTTGIITAGKSLAGLQELGKCFRERTLRKYYHCIVRGRVKKAEHIKGYLVKDRNKNRVSVREEPLEGAEWIETEYRPAARGRDFTLLEVHLITGKPHQIRGHLASVGHPILGDYKYGDRRLNDDFRSRYGLTSQLLHACRLEFPQMEGTLSYLSGQIFTAQEPEIFQRIQRELTGEKGIWEHGTPEA